MYYCFPRIILLALIHIFLCYGDILNRRRFKTNIVILFILAFIHLSTYAQYYETIAEIKALDGKIDTLRYHPNYDSTFTEKFRIQGIASNTTIPVDWVAIGFGTGNAQNYNKRYMEMDPIQLDYQLYDSITTRNILKEFTKNRAQDNMITIYVGGETEDFRERTSFDIEVPSGQMVTNGLYKDQSISVELWGLLDVNGTGPQTTLTPANQASMILLDSMTFKLHANADSIIRTAITERNGAFAFDSLPYKINFGTLDPSETKEADLIIEATSSYSINVESLQGNRLKHKQVAEYVDYSFSFNNTIVALPAGIPTNLVTNAPASFSPGDRYPIDIQIGSVIGFVPAGTYKEVLSFTITAN